MSDAETLAWYEANAPRFAFSFGTTHSVHLDGFLDRLAPGARILELGCGTGQDAARMIERGFDLDATDATSALIRKAKERFGVEARQMRFDELDAIETYDAVWAHACLLHVARAELPDIVERVRKALRPGGWHYANYKLGDGEARDPLGRLTNFPATEWLEAIYRDAAFVIDAAQKYRGKGADGVRRDWYALTVRRG